MAKTSVVVVDDDDNLRESLCDFLRSVGFDALGVESAEALDRQLSKSRFDIAICDANLPKENGYSLVGRLRRLSAIGIIMLTGRTGRDDRMVGLSLGADYYLVKPVDLGELDITIRNLHKRLSAEAANAPKAASVPGPDSWEFDAHRWLLVAPHGAMVQLSLVEFSILKSLISRAGEVVSRGELLQSLRRPNIECISRNIDMTISRLRKKIEDASGMKLPIASARGHGYVFTGQVRMVS